VITFAYFQARETAASLVPAPAAGGAARGESETEKNDMSVTALATELASALRSHASSRLIWNHFHEGRRSRREQTRRSAENDGISLRRRCYLFTEEAAMTRLQQSLFAVLVVLASTTCISSNLRKSPPDANVSVDRIGVDSGTSDSKTNGDGGGGGSGQCQPGSPCLVADSPCLTGETECNGGTVTCKKTDKPVANGTVCGADAVCGVGVCMPCTRGASCALEGKPCRSGAIECGAGKPECLETGNAADGTSCGAGMVCQQGTCTTCMAGSGCVPMNPCHEGALECSGAAPVCNDTARLRPTGQACGTDKVCNAGGECVACKAGMTCDLADPCKVGKIDCITGVPVCVETGPAAPGKSCGNSLVCNEGRCVSCTEGQSCTPTNKCHAGTLSCMTGTPQCMDANRNLANGTSCGTNQVCNNGTCADCTANVSCDTGNPCKLGTTSCSTGTSQCREAGNAPNGRGCGAGRVCSDGSCVACTPNTACQPSACKVGTTSCSTGTSECRETGNAANGSSCGTDRVCNNGSCNNCNQGGTCTLSNPCKRGTISCSTGASVCMDAGNVNDGTGCGGSRVCVGGTCRDCNPSAPPICRNGQRITCTSGGTENVDNCGGNGCVGTACNNCRPGSVRCSGNQLQDCNNSGDWQTRMTCNLGCSNNQCITCQPSTEVCNGRDDDCDNQSDEGNLCTSGPSGSTGRCNGSAGCGYTCPAGRTNICNNVCQECCTAGQCGSGMTCRNNQCEATCPENERRCSGNQPQVCNGGNWQNEGTACLTPCNFCSNGTCQRRPDPTGPAGSKTGTVCIPTECHEKPEGGTEEITGFCSGGSCGAIQTRDCVSCNGNQGVSCSPRFPGN
jgi:hypothetical protein